MQPKSAFILAGAVIPIFTYVVTTVTYAHGGYDGKHCAGLLDAVWECSEFEYYLDWLFNPFAIIALIGYVITSAVVTPLAWYLYRKYKKS